MTDTQTHAQLGKHGIVDALLPLAVPILNLESLPGNPRRGDVDAVARSYRQFGQRKPVVAKRTGVDENGTPRGIVLAGNHQLVAARERLTWDSLAVVFVDDDEMTAKAFALADNRTADLGTYDDDLLAELLAEIVATGDDALLVATGYDEHALNDLLGGNEGYDGGDGDDEEPDEPPPADDVEPKYDADTLIQLALEHFRERGFPYPQMPIHEAMQLVNRLAATPTDSLRSSNTAHMVADVYHPHRFSVPINGRKLPTDTFEHDDKLRHALRLLIDEGMMLRDTPVRNAMAFVRNAQAAGNFRPGFALWGLRSYCPQGGVWLDTSTGFGGRLVAFAASHMSRYIGIDPSTKTHAGNTQLAADLRLDGRVTLICEPAEDVALQQIGGANSVDVALTSPPYFSKEHYADEDTQSYKRYPTPDEWRDGFLLPMLRLQFAALKPGAYNIVNIADVKIKGDVVPLADMTTQAALDAGFEHESTDHLPLKRVPGRGVPQHDNEPTFVFRKPGGKR